jgi:CRP-like cAMP-binding protein
MRLTFVAGEVAVDVESPSGRRARVARLGRDQIVGEISILGDVPRTATALGRTTTLKIAKDLFFRMVSDFPSMAVEVMRVLAHRVEHINAVLRECQDKLAVADRA